MKAAGSQIRKKKKTKRDTTNLQTKCADESGRYSGKTCMSTLVKLVKKRGVGRLSRGEEASEEESSSPLVYARGVGVIVERRPTPLLFNSFTYWLYYWNL